MRLGRLTTSGLFLGLLVGLLGIGMVIPESGAQQQGTPAYGTYQPAPSVSPSRGGVSPLSASAQSQGAGENIMILLDSSLSMEEPLSTGETKMAAAKRTIMEVLSKVPPTTRVGLRVYGQSASLLGCRSTATLVPLGTNNRMQIAASLLRVRPTGPTPISLSIRRSINEDFNGIPGNRHVILVSDGAETCDTDPCGVAVDMVRNNINVKIDVVGYGIHDLYAVRQLRCIALSTYGKFYKADTAAQLADSLGKAMQSETNVQGRILVPGGGGP